MDEKTCTFVPVLVVMLDLIVKQVYFINQIIE